MKSVYSWRAAAAENENVSFKMFVAKELFVNLYKLI